VAADDGAVFAASQNGLDEAELSEAQFKGVEFLVTDASRIGRVRSQQIDGDLLDR
jgi:hypothetical protein